MKHNHILALIIGYYLSKYDDLAYKNLGYVSGNETHKEIGKILGVKPASVKNMRDEFDPIHDNQRVGWYQRPLRSSRAKVVESFQDLEEEELRDIVFEILTNPNFNAIPEVSSLVDSIAKGDKSKKNNTPFIVRGITGRKAEEIFIKYHQQTMKPMSGMLIDRRDYGVGYDFEIKEDASSCFVEVKGLIDEDGGVVFTSKEWDVARKKVILFSSHS
ncbi:MAG: DUF3883 domain-containing protein [Anaerolineales bacterium]|uniref:protein NO VEIN domain-containing protein n=1 Tax=Candidatus Villigracilis vicinus TaxID=3140679 RepID=UPI0031367F80|nr:DUF3883 domain-containing protein [Anaerolineales bacterium]